MITDLVVKVSLTGAGSAVMWFLVLLSIISLTVVIERWVFFVKNSGAADLLAQQIGGKLAAGETEEAHKILKEESGFAAKVVSAALEVSSKGKEAMSEMAQSTAKVEKLRFEKGLAFLGTLGNNAPFIGLFGTVLEIIAALSEMGNNSAGQVGATAVMSTLSAALAATAVGLLVALPAVAFYNYFSRRLKSLNTGAEALLHVVFANR